MAERKFSEQEIIEKTKTVLHSFYNRDIPAVVALMDEDCVWIGTYDSQYTYGKKAFLEETKPESKETAVQILQEEYGLLFHEKKYSAVYGRYTVAGEQDDGTVLLAKVRLTFIWKQVGDDLLAIHIHCADARDVPLQYESSKVEELSQTLSWFEYIRRIDTQTHQAERVLLKDRNGLVHTLLPMEILYVKASDKESTVYTGAESFVTNYSLRELEGQCPFLLRTHKSYLVHPAYIKGIRRYSLTLQNGVELPVSKGQYMDIKKRLSQK